MKMKLRHNLLAGMVAICLSVPFCATANDLGSYGESFPIIETNLLEMMLQKLNTAKQNGTLDKMNADLTARSKKHMEEPDPLPGIHTTVNPRSWLFDPSFVVTADIADQKGQVFAHRGDMINPLERMPAFNEQMVFIDARDPKQVSLALATAKKAGDAQVRIIATAGKPLELMRKYSTYIFYDQNGILTGKFGITQVPALIKREGNKLRISEVKP